MAQCALGRARRDGNVCRSGVSCYAGDGEGGALRIDTSVQVWEGSGAGVLLASRPGVRLCRWRSPGGVARCSVKSGSR